MERAELIENITAVLAEIRPVLEACRIKTAPIPAGAREKRLAAVFQSLQEFERSEAIAIFKAAEALRPPGALNLWAQDKKLRDAREVRIYLKAVQLVRTTWCEAPHLTQFFKKGKPLCPVKTNKPNKKHEPSPDSSGCPDQEPDEVAAT